MEIPFNELKKEIIGLLKKNKILVLATCCENRVTARSMSCVNMELSILFQTDKEFLKYEQIVNNSNVALCAGNMQIEGTAVIRNHPLDESNKEFIELYKDSHLGSYEKYSHLENNVVIEVRPTVVTLWKYVDGMPCRDYLYVQEGKAKRERYDISN